MLKKIWAQWHRIDNVWLTFRRCGPWTEFVWLSQSLFDWQITGHRFFQEKNNLKKIK
jgi:hypothetical protein